MDYISKKELLSATGISYGQLYRWKREGLIPEEWFIKRSSYTGQETFFPREQVLSRISSILEMKESHSLESLAVIFSPDAPVTTELNPLEIKEISSQVSSIISEDFGLKTLTLPQAALVVSLEKALSGFEPGVIATLCANGFRSGLQGSDYSCAVFTENGNYRLAFTKGSEKLFFSPPTKITAEFYLGSAADLLSLKYSEENKSINDRL